MIHGANQSNDSPDFEAARQYVLRRLETELSPRLRYHCAGHTRDEVLPAVTRLAALEGVTGEELLLLQTAALFHDLGFVVQYQHNESIGAQIAAEVLPGFGFAEEQIDRIRRMILATALPQAPQNRLEAILADADLDVLGSTSFWTRNQDLRTELAFYDETYSDAEWYAGQLRLLQEHSYWTEAARGLRNAGKEDHIEALSRLVTRCQAVSREGKVTAEK